MRPRYRSMPWTLLHFYGRRRPALRLPPSAPGSSRRSSAPTPLRISKRSTHAGAAIPSIAGPYHGLLCRADGPWLNGALIAG